MYKNAIQNQGKRPAEAISSALVGAIFMIIVYIAFCLLTSSV